MSSLNLSAKRIGSALSPSAISNSSTFRTHLNVINFISERELEVLQLIADGSRAKEIAHKLRISIHTVTSHKLNIMTKLEVTNVASMISAGFRLGLLK